NSVTRRRAHRLEIPVLLSERVAGHGYDALPDLEADDPWSDRGNFACGIGAKNMRQRKFARVRTLAQIVFKAVDAGSENLDDDLARFWRGGRDVFVTQDSRPSVLMENCSFHRYLPSSR